MFRKLDIAVFIFILLIISLSWPLMADDTADEIAEETTEEWESFSVSEGFSADLQAIYDELFNKDKFELIGKLMTLLLEKEKKGYQIKRIDQNQFSIKSRQTIREGSIITIERMNTREFVFTGHLLIQKVFEFDCDIKVATSYQHKGDQIYASSVVKYQAPPLIGGIDQLIYLLTGENFVSNKIISFLERMHLVFARLAELEPEEWTGLARQQKRLRALVYPVEFTSKEIVFITQLLDKF